MDNRILIHAEQVGRAAFGDPRLVKRGLFYFDSFSVPPASRLHPFGLGICPIRPVMISGFLIALRAWLR